MAAVHIAHRVPKSALRERCKLGSRTPCLRRPRLLRVSASRSDDVAPVSLPLFMLGNVLHPSQTGTLRVFEPRYLTLFKDQQQQAAAASGQLPIRFGHILAPEAAPPALLDGDGSVAGLPSVGVYARVTKIEEERQSGLLTVHYEGVRRFKLLAVDKEREPYYMAAVQWYDDQLESLPPQDRQLVDELEREVMGALAEVARLSQRLGVPLPQQDQGAAGAAAGAQQLPAAVLRYSPPLAVRKTTADYLREAGIPAGEAIATWQRHGSVYGTPAARKKSAPDPYQHLREQIAKERRQELFSFAAASCLELGLIERLALLLSQDTAARLSYVSAAVKPYINDLAARVAVKSAIGGGST